MLVLFASLVRVFLSRCRLARPHTTESDPETRAVASSSEPTDPPTVGDARRDHTRSHTAPAPIDSAFECLSLSSTVRAYLRTRMYFCVLLCVCVLPDSVRHRAPFRVDPLSRARRCDKRERKAIEQEHRITKNNTDVDGVE